VVEDEPGLVAAKKIAQINGRATAPGTLQLSNHSIGFIAAM